MSRIAINDLPVETELCSEEQKYLVGGWSGIVFRGDSDYDFEYSADTTANDTGGAAVRNTWTDLNGNLQISQINPIA